MKLKDLKPFEWTKLARCPDRLPECGDGPTSYEVCWCPDFNKVKICVECRGGHGNPSFRLTGTKRTREFLNAEIDENQKPKKPMKVPVEVDRIKTPCPDRQINRKICEFVAATELIPRGWDLWFWAKISDNAPFSWGDNNRSMVCAYDFKRHCEDRLMDASDDEGVPQKDIDRFLELLEDLGPLYVDLEN